MIRVALKNLITHKIRTGALILTIVLGVSFVVGTYVLTDTVTHVFDDIFTDVYSGIDVSVRHTSPLGLDATRPPVPESLLVDIAAIDGVRAAEGTVFAIGVDIIDADGQRVGNPMAPTFGTVWSHDPSLSPFTLRAGRVPAGADEVAIDAQSFDDGHFSLGDPVTLITGAGPRQFALVGVAGFGEASNLAGATISIFELNTAQQLLGRVDAFDSIDIAADPGVNPAALQDSIAAALADDYEAVTGTDLSAETGRSISESLAYFKTFMLVFAFVALFVGAFIVYNTYSIVIAERTREFALVRALGASGASVLASVIVEAVITGLVAAAVGIGVGVGIAVGLQHLLDAVGFSMPTGNLTLLPRTVWVAIVGGPAVTVCASVVPALRASRVAPLAAMRQASGAEHSGAVRNIVGAVAAAGGVTAVVVGLDRSQLAAVGAGAAALFLGIALVAPLISVPAVAVIGAPIQRVRGIAGLLARDNARRSPRRTATTASALMIGTALMAASFILSQSINTSVERAVTGSVVADLVVASANQTGFSDALATEIEAVPSVASVARLRTARFKIGNATKSLVALPSAAIDRDSPKLAIDVGIVDGDVTHLSDDGIGVRDAIASQRHWAIGDAIEVTFPTGTRTLTLMATYSESTLVGDYLIDLTTFAVAYVDTADVVVVINVGSADVTAAQTAVDAIIDARYPGLDVRDRDQYVSDMKAQVAQFTSLITALLVLAVVIALLGVLITMLLSVSERVREIGLLRAVGMSRSQIRSMIRWEALIVSLFGAILGLALGVFFGLALVDALSEQGVTESVVPVTTLCILAAVIALLGVLASVYPAGRAARLNVIDAVANL